MQDENTDNIEKKSGCKQTANGEVTEAAEKSLSLSVIFRIFRSSAPLNAIDEQTASKEHQMRTSSCCILKTHGKHFQVEAYLPNRASQVRQSECGHRRHHKLVAVS